MNTDHVDCKPDRIELYLRQQLSNRESTEFESHLQHCSACRSSLKESAAPPQTWDSIGESLQSLGDWQEMNDSPIDAASRGQEDSEFATDLLQQILSPSDDERMMGRLASYEVVGVIGVGGMGVVVKAFDSALNRYVAIKILSPHLSSNGAARRRFSREAKAAAAVVHENVIEIYGVADAHGLPYLVMPYSASSTLQKRLDTCGPLTVVEVLRVGKQAAEGLAAAHAQGLVHRDVKPANILLTEGAERVKLTDFGLARAADDASLTKTGVIAGTPQYMSPEQARGDTVNHSSDLFSLGSVMYAMCTGRPPFRAETSYGILRRITDNMPRPIREINPDIPQWLAAVIDQLMAKDVADRFQSADQVADLLRRCLAHVQQPLTIALPQQCVTALPPARSEPLVSEPLTRRRRFTGRGLMAAAALGLAMLAAGALALKDAGQNFAANEASSPRVAVDQETSSDIGKSTIDTTDDAEGRRKHGVEDREFNTESQNENAPANDPVPAVALPVNTIVAAKPAPPQSANEEEGGEEPPKPASSESNDDSVKKKEPAPVWGKTTDGIQLGISGVPDKTPFHQGDLIRFSLHLKNASSETMSVRNYWPRLLGRVIPPVVETAEGERARFPSVPRVRGGHHRLLYTLAPGETAKIELMGMLTIGKPGDQFPGKLPSERCWCALAPGDYRIYAGFFLTKVDPDSDKPLAKPFTLSSGKVNIRVLQPKLPGT